MANRLFSGWWIELDAEATLALIEGYKQPGRAYALLHESGSLMRDEHGPLVAASWPDVCALARVNSAVWVLSLTDRRAIRMTHGKTSVYAEGTSAILLLNKQALESLTVHDNSTHQEIVREETNPKASKRPSGAENRRRKRAG